METLKFLVKFLALVFLCAMAAVSTGGVLLIPAIIIIIGYAIHYICTTSNEKKIQGTGSAKGVAGKASKSATTPPPASPTTHKICCHCGAQNALNGVYCEACGYKLP